MDWLVVARLVGGLVILVVGAESLVRGASRLALALGISPLVVGLTVVAFGTSAPELAISILAGVRGQSDLAFGNVVGSNVFNVLLILGLSALVTPLVVDRVLVRREVPLMIAVSLVAAGLGLDGRIGRLEGAVLLVALAAYVVLSVRAARREPPAAIELPRVGEPVARRSPAFELVPIAVGLGLLVAGSHLFVGGAIDLARHFGVSELVIGLTLVAAGTSLPEVATSLVAAFRGERDLAVGNVVGSNLFNLLGVLGAASLFTRGGVEVAATALRFDVPVMIAAAVACLPIFFTGYRISRGEGAFFLLAYVVYLVHVVLDAADHPALHTFREAVLVFVLPLTALTLGILLWRLRGRRRGDRGVS